MAEEMTLEQRVIDAINQIRPSLQNDGGDIEFVSMEGKNINVKLLGACAGCPMSQATLKNGVEKYLRHTVDPELVVENSLQF
ncbi:MAG: NifU family protein [Bullifex sp.]|nr:NifU family protein [Spirochaetales bacterium]MDY2816538.1 NifU family protein [Bullifex sp.]MDD7009222.1 NifU family protein [Spirochaetales bacterium]MDD7535824.1 NifU family protein [Spirochaetales bacterium]MDY3849780.1 NifU family protein [Bullifex sp.]